MDTTLKQRILGVVVLVAILGFCLSVLLRNTKEVTPSVSKINLHPPLVQTTPSTSAGPASGMEIKVKPVEEDTTSVPKASVFSSSEKSVQPAPASQNVSFPALTPTKAASEAKLSSSSVEASSVAQISSTASAQPKLHSSSGELPSVPQQSSAVPPVSNISPPPVVKSSHASASTAAGENKKSVHSHSHAISALPSSSSSTAISTLKVQVGTFSVEANAKALAEKLRQKGFAATIQKVKTAKGEMTRVIVGEKNLNHAQAEALRQKLHKLMNLPGIIVSS